jgi:hypothetical protein
MISTCQERLQGEAHVSSEMGGALISAVLILLLITVFSTAGFWLARVEVGASQGYAQAMRSLNAAESGFARYFAARVPSDSVAMTFEFYADPCLDTLAYPTVPEQTTCQAEDESEEDDLLEDLEAIIPPPELYAFLDAEVIVTADFIMNDGGTPIYELFSRATTTDPRNAALTTTRLLAMYGQLEPPFEINSVFAAVGGIDFAGDANDHYHFDGLAKAGKTGQCGTTVAVPNLTVPEGQWDLPPPNGYKWHSKGMKAPADVDSTFTSAQAIKDDIDIDWSELLNNSFYNGVSNVIAMDNSDDLEDYFTKDKDKAFKSAPEWPIVRFTGDLNTDQRVKGYGILIVDGDVTVSADKLEWTGLLLVGGKVITLDGSHIHVKGATVAGLGCTEQDVTDGLCRSELSGDHNDLKYRPCSIAQAWRRLMVMEPRDGLWREISGN